MFSEYASRFLSQSQSELADGADRTRRIGQIGSRFPPSRPYFNRRLGNPYQSSAHLSRFKFSSRESAHYAPLFHSNADEFREEDDEQEREREVADFYALQKSRRNFGSTGPGQLEESSEFDDDLRESQSTDENDGFGRGRGIKSSWRGGKTGEGLRGSGVEHLPAHAEDEHDNDQSSQSISSGKGKMVDVRLDDTLKSVPAHEEGDEDYYDEPPAWCLGREQSAEATADDQTSDDSVHQEANNQPFLNEHQPAGSSASPVPPAMTSPQLYPPHHDVFWGHLFLLCLAGLFASAFVVFLNTSAPTGKPGLGDTIYSTLHRSFSLLGVYTLVSIFVSLLWLALLRSYVRPLVYVVLIAAPVILYSFSLYPFISSFKGTWHGGSVQDKAMRWGSLVPAIIATIWLYCVAKGRHSIGKAIGILEFSCKILSANPALLLVGFGALATIAAWTWLWMLMFTRVFLGGHVNPAKSIFVIDPSSWWIGIGYILVYLWSLGVLAGIQRTTTAATVSQWYFYRFIVPAPTSQEVVREAFVHSCTTLFGTICLSTMLSLMIRLPLIILPRRLSGFISLAAYSLVPTPITSLTSPLALTYAAVHSKPLVTSARSLSHMTFIAPQASSTSVHPRLFSDARRPEIASLIPYRLAKLLLHATRIMMSLALGFGGWVSTARRLQVSSGGITIRGSLYAYVVGLIAGAIGWGVLSAMEGVLAGVVDAALVCWATEVGSTRREARYCREADLLFGGGANGYRGVADRDYGQV
ncbi:hypothetical protein VTO42DRAFT_8202 [Malbranchea cinnamomea]